MQMIGRLKKLRFSIKAIKFGLDARLALYRGVEILSEAVEITLGPKGKTVILQPELGEVYPRITKDGFTVAKAIELRDPFWNLGAHFTRYAAIRVNEVAGDGTTTVICLFREMFREGLRMTAGGLDPFAIRRGMHLALDQTLSILDAMSQKGEDKMEQVAFIASRGDHQITRVISDVLLKVGKEGSVTIERGHKAEHSYEFVQGYRYNRGLTTTYFAAGTKSGVCELVDSLLLMTTLPIRTVGQVQQFIENAKSQRKSLFIICDEIDNEVISAFIKNNAEGATKIICAFPPDMGENRRREMNDISVLTGALVVDGEMGMEWSSVDSEVLGLAKKILCSIKSTVFVAPKETPLLKERVAQVKSQMQKATTAFERGEFEQRLGRLSGGVAVVWAGGRTAVEISEAKDRMEDALYAATWARDSGVLLGGGTALAKASCSLNHANCSSLAESCGIELVKLALKRPLVRMANNSGFSGKFVSSKVTEIEDLNVGFCFSTGNMIDLSSQGIYDSTEVVKTALKEAVSLAGLLLTAEMAIVDIPRANAGPMFPSKKELADSTSGHIQGLLGV